MNSSKHENINNIIDEITPNLNTFALRLTKNLDDAKDLYQETVFKILTNINKFKVGTNIKAWSYTIMRNTFINGYRKKQRRNTISDSTDENYYLNSAQDIVPNDGETMIAIQEMEQEINLLRDDWRIPFLMHYTGFKYQEIADHLELPLGTVKSKIFHARKHLQSKLQHIDRFND
jgi:RNA polymerase sigma-70 factor (ECF subfamily)